MQFIRASTAFSKGASSAAVAVVFGDSSNISFTALPTYWGNSARSRYLSMAAMAPNKFLNLESHFFHLFGIIPMAK